MALAQVKRRKERTVSSEVTAIAFVKAVNAVVKPVQAKAHR